MAVTAQSAAVNTPMSWEVQFGQADSSGIINVKDWLVWSGNKVVPTYAGGLAYWKASAAGIAIEASPQYDMMGRSLSATALRFMREGTILATAAFSGQPALGVGAYPVSTGSGVASPTGLSGIESTWQTGAKQTYSGATGAGGSGVSTVIGWRNSGPAGTGQLELLVLAPRPDYY